MALPTRLGAGLNQRAQTGFTLLEMIVVLAILGLALGLVISRGPMHSARLDADVAARELTAALRLARGRAIAEDRPVAVALAANSYLVDGSAVHRVPVDVTLAGNAAIRFAPDGSSSGGTIVVQAAASRVTIGVDWLTGRVGAQGLRP
jgi:general secretion pathway protein H